MRQPWNQPWDETRAPSRKVYWYNIALVTPTKNTLNSCVAFYIVSGFRLNQFKDHFETVRVTPLDNALAWDHTNAASTPWVHFAGDASRSESLNDLRYTEAFSAGEIFALHGVPKGGGEI